MDNRGSVTARRQAENGQAGKKNMRLGAFAGIALASTMLGCLGAAAPAIAKPAAAGGEAVNFSIPAQPLPAAIDAFIRATGWQISYSSQLARGKTSSAVSGRMTPAAALRRLVASAGLDVRVGSAGSAALVAASGPAAGAAPVAGAVQLDTIDVNGRADPATTEGSDSYSAEAVTVAGKVATPLKETPSSVSVITRKRIEDQNLDSVDDALRQATGVTAIPYGDGTYYFNARGFPLDAQYDGMPVASGIQYLSQFDMSIYDRAEIQRGPAGLLQGSGSPAGTVNFVRRMPLDHFALSTDTQYGSWDFIRQTVDVTGPLNQAGTARGRLIVTGQDRNFFYDEGGEWHGTFYGALQFDLSPQTTLSLASTYQKQRLAPFDYGQSLASDGGFIDAPRSTFYGADWSYTNYAMAEEYANLKHEFDNGWVSNTTLFYRNMRDDGKYAYMDTTDYGNGVGLGVDPTNNLADYALQSGDINMNWFGVDSNLSGNYDFLGRESRFVVGLNYSYRTERQFSGFYDAGEMDIFTAHSQLPDVDIPLIFGENSRTQEGGVYGKTDLKLADPLTLVLGGRLSWYQNRHIDLLDPEAGWLTDHTTNGKFTPYAGVVYDVNKNVSVYASYTDIFTPQDQETLIPGGLPPRTGSQYEVGVKGSFLDDRLTTSLALFDINDDHRAVESDMPDKYVAAGKARSRGVEAEVNGEIVHGWNISAGYTYLDTKYLSDPENGGLALDPEEPKHAFKLWTRYTFDSGKLDGLSLGAGLRAFSRTERSLQGATGPAASATQGAYALVDAQIAYKINDHFDASFTVKNVFDKKYFDRLPLTYFGIYGEPRSFLLGVKSHW